MKLKNEQLKPIIDEILSYYYNTKTRLNHDRKAQESMVSQNAALKNACSAVIYFSDNEEELLEYTRNKINEINQGEAQEISFK